MELPDPVTVGKQELSGKREREQICSIIQKSRPFITRADYIMTIWLK